MQLCFWSNRMCKAGPPALLRISFVSDVLKAQRTVAFWVFKKKIKIQILFLCSCSYYPVSFILDCCLSAWL